MEEFSQQNDLQQEASIEESVVKKKKKKTKEEKKAYKKGILVGIVLTLLVCVVLTTGIVFVVKGKMGDSVLSSGVKTKINFLTGIINEYYYEDVDTSKMSDGLYKGLVESLGDKYSAYYTPEEYEELMIDTTGNYAGIGAMLTQDAKTNQVYVLKIYDGSPAQKAKLKEGDEIISVDGNEAEEYSLDDFVQYIRGDKGTEVKIEVLHQGDEETEEYTITRDEVTVPSVSYDMLAGNIGYINISEFSSGTQEEYEKAMADLQAQGMKAVIFDLRTNGGGLVDSVTAILDDILPEGLTLYMEDKNGNRQEFKSDEEKQIDMPIAVLTSQYTASAAEIFAGAIRDFHYGTLIGVKTYGKGIVQTTIPLNDGSALKLTTARYYTPSGECIHKKGIEPDIELEYEYTGDQDADYSYDYDNQIQKAIEVLESQEK